MRQRGAGDAQVGGLRVADAVDGAGDPVQQERQRGAGQSGEPLAYQRREKGDEAERGEDCDQGNTDHVGGQREDGGAMEVHGHGKHHDGFGDEADQRELNGPEDCNPRSLRGVSRPLAEDAGEWFAPHAERDSQFREARGNRRVAPEMVKIAGGASVGQEAALAQRHGDARDGHDGEKGHLEAGLKESAGRPDEDSERGCAEGVESVALAGEKARERKTAVIRRARCTGTPKPVSSA